MNLEQMREYLQDYYEIPIALRQQGTTNIECPYCGKKHDHGQQPGHHVAGCAGSEYGTGITVKERFFVPNYGYTIFEYEEGDGVNELTIPPNMMNPK